MAVPVILRGVLQEVDPAWKLTKIASDISGGAFKANTKCGSPFEPFNSDYMGYHWPLSFIATPLGLAASGIWTAGEPLPCRIAKAEEAITCNDIDLDPPPCGEEES